MSVFGVLRVVALALVLALVATARVPAAEVDPFAVVVAYVGAGQYDAARTYAIQYGKTPRAKAVNAAFVDALVLKHQGRLEEAAAAMRALLAVSPRFDLVRTELAHTLYLMGEYEAAQHHFELLSAAARFPASRSLYDRFLMDIRRKRPWTFNAFVNIAPSTNINNGLNSGVVEIGGIEFSGATEKESGIGLGYGADGSYRFDLAGRLDLTVGGSVVGVAYTNHDYDVLTGQAFAELGVDAAPWRFGMAAAAERVLSGWNGYSWGLGPQFSVRRDFGRAGTLMAVAGWRALLHDRNPERDGSETRLSVKHRYAFNPATEIALGATYSHVTADVAFNGYDAIKPAVEVYREFTGGFIVDARAAYEFRRYAAEFPLLDHAREDGRLELAVGVTHRRLSAHGFAPRLEYVYRRNDSNIELFRTDSHGLNLTFTRRY